jgi:hypothetical protein
LSCSELTTLDDFGNGILVGEAGDDYFTSKMAKIDDDVCFAHSVTRMWLTYTQAIVQNGNTTFREQEGFKVFETVQSSGHTKDSEHRRREEPEYGKLTSSDPSS